MARHYLKRKADTSTNPAAATTDVSTIVRDVIEDIRQNGDAAVRRYSSKFDKWTPDAFKLSRKDIERIMAQVPEQTIQDIRTVQSNVRRFAEAQKAALKDVEVETEPGVFLGHQNIPIQNVGA